MNALLIDVAAMNFGTWNVELVRVCPYLREHFRYSREAFI